MDKKRGLMLITATVLLIALAFVFITGTGFLDTLKGSSTPAKETEPPATGEVSEPVKEPALPIEERFPAEKELVVQIEGTEEKIIGRLTIGKNESYIIYIDEERYKMVAGQEADPDMIIPKEALPEGYPEVSMAILHTPDIAPADRAVELAEHLKSVFPDLKETEKVEEPVEGFLLHGIANGGQEWDDPVINAYVVSDGQQGSFTLSEKYFLEAAEGHGARFYSMAQEFMAIAPE
ncbi:hypothetical protein [Planococcus koreensis]|uniref:hypothetical protein n=1 Tax=Planococcus koreensis TaxID=112331 RepID=UPI0039FCAC36